MAGDAGRRSQLRRRPLRMALALAVTIAAGAMAVQLARVDADWGPPLGADRLLDRAERADPAEKAALARAALRARPLDGRAYRVLGDAARASGRPHDASALYRIAVARWPRERLGRARLAQEAFEAGELETALVHVDALLRVAPAARRDVLASLMPMLGDPRLRAALVDRLALDPPWRGALPAPLRDASTSAASAEALLAELAARVPASEQERLAHIVLLERLGRAQDARRLWLASVDADDSPHATTPLVFDGGFERPGVTGGYGWQLDPPPGIGIVYEPHDAAEGASALALTFEGRPVRLHGQVRQALALTPGGYRLQARSHNGTDAARPFVWRVACRGEGRALLAQLELRAGSGWQSGETAFDVPAHCTQQELRLHHLGRSLAEQRIAGTLRLDGIRIIPSR